MKIYGEFEIETGEMMVRFIRCLEENGIAFKLVDENYFKANVSILQCVSEKKTIELILSELGIRFNTTGGRVLRELVPSYDSNIRLKDLYQEYAAKLGMSQKQVEKGIYNARKTVRRNNPELYAKLFTKSNSISYFLGELKSMI